jgi:O-6-methylguanine DNA methyltransferase
MQIATFPLLQVLVQTHKSKISKIDLAPAPAFFCSDNTPQPLIDWLASYAEGTPLPLPLHLLETFGTRFMQEVYAALAAIPFGSIASYQAVAERVGRPKASRAVGTACGRNPFPLLIPCHRVLASNGLLGGFAYGLPMKKDLLFFETKVL